MFPCILSLDISSKCTGFAVGVPDSKPVFGVFRKAAHDPNDFGPVYLAFEEWLYDLVTVHSPRHLCFEAPLPSVRQASINAGRLSLGLVAHAEKVGSSRGLIVEECNNQTLKLQFAGTGSASKAQMIRMCHMLGYPVTNEDEADAVALWHYGCRLYAPSSRTAQHHLQGNGTPLLTSARDRAEQMFRRNPTPQNG